jgi:hypothetical protein
MWESAIIPTTVSVRLGGVHLRRAKAAKQLVIGFSHVRLRRSQWQRHRNCRSGVGAFGVARKPATQDASPPDRFYSALASFESLRGTRICKNERMSLVSNSYETASPHHARKKASMCFQERQVLSGVGTSSGCKDLVDLFRSCREVLIVKLTEFRHCETTHDAALELSGTWKKQDRIAHS